MTALIMPTVLMRLEAFRVPVLLDLVEMEQVVMVTKLLTTTVG